MICSSFVLFVLVFLIFALCLMPFRFFLLLFISFVFLLGWSTALVSSKLAGILINNCYINIQLATSKSLQKVTFHAGLQQDSSLNS